MESDPIGLMGAGSDAYRMWYSKRTKRFVSRNGSALGPSSALYGYANNSPSRFLDATGLKEVCYSMTTPDMNPNCYYFPDPPPKPKNPWTPMTPPPPTLWQQLDNCIESCHQDNGLGWKAGGASALGDFIALGATNPECYPLVVYGAGIAGAWGTGWEIGTIMYCAADCQRVYLPGVPLGGTSIILPPD